MCTKFQVDWTSTSSKTTSTKNFNLKGRTDKRMDPQTRKHNAHLWGIKNQLGCTEEASNDLHNTSSLLVSYI